MKSGEKKREPEGAKNVKLDATLIRPMYAEVDIRRILDLQAVYSLLDIKQDRLKL